MGTALKNQEEKPRAIVVARGNRVKSARMFAGLSRKEIYHKYGIHPESLRAWETPSEKQGGLTKKGSQRIIEALLSEGIICTEEWLMTGLGDGPKLLNKTYISHSVEEDKVNLIEYQEDNRIQKEIQYFQVTNPSPVVIMIGSDALEPYFEKGGYVAGNKVFGQDIEQLSDLLCIVGFTNKTSSVYRLDYNKDKDTFHLSRYKNSNTVITKRNNEIEFAAEIVWYRKNSTPLNKVGDHMNEVRKNTAVLFSHVRQFYYDDFLSEKSAKLGAISKFIESAFVDCLVEKKLTKYLDKPYFLSTKTFNISIYEQPNIGEKIKITLSIDSSTDTDLVVYFSAPSHSRPDDPFFEGKVSFCFLEQKEDFSVFLAHLMRESNPT